MFLWRLEVPRKRQHSQWQWPLFYSLSQTQFGNPGGDTNSPEWCGAKNRAEWLAQCGAWLSQLLQMALCNTLRVVQPAVIQSNYPNSMRSSSLSISQGITQHRPRFSSPCVLCFHLMLNVIRKKEWDCCVSVRTTNADLENVTGFFLQHHENTPRGGKIMSHKTWLLGALHYCVLLIASVFSEWIIMISITSEWVVH